MNVKDALHKAYSEEAKASVKLKVYADKAITDGYPQMAKLFEAIARSEMVHASRALNLLAEVGNTEDNLSRAFEAEKDVAGPAYNDFVKIAEAVGDKAAVLHFSQSRDVEETHANLYKQALSHMMEERETTYWICGFCGFVSDGVLPEECPICGFPKERFNSL
ncbi:MAG: rubrerythrin family protein [Deltaproteobacteria bacterium]|nr:rubrerythrin family protein [Deltaproteobacteria bacterium]